MAKANRTKKAGERGWGEVGGKRVGVGFADKGGSEMEEEGGRGGEAGRERGRVPGE